MIPYIENINLYPKGVCMIKKMTRKELDALYEAIPLKKSESLLLRKYCKAAAHLYGMIPMKKLWEIILLQNSGKFTKKQFNAFANIATMESEDYAILGDEDVYADGKYTTPVNRTLYYERILWYDDELFFELQNAQKSKTYYIPSKEEFLKYAKKGYYEETIHSQNLKEYIDSLFPVEPQKAERLFKSLIAIDSSQLRHAATLGRILEQHQLDIDQVQKLLDLYMRFGNYSRLRWNLGHTPQEIFEMHQIHDSEISLDENMSPYPEIPFEKTPVLEPVVRMTPKINRNDPCPCGSGQKYKRCCGKLNP